MPLPLQLIELQQHMSPAIQQSRLSVGMQQGTQLSSRGTPLARLANRSLDDAAREPSCRNRSDELNDPDHSDRQGHG